MVFKEDVLQWFKEMESYERIELMHELLQMCLPFEIRFLGGCVEEVGKHSFQELRGPSIVANDIDKLAKDATQLSTGVLDRNCRHRMCVYLSLLENRNCQCAHWYFKRVFRTERFDEFAMRQKCLDDGVVLNELLMVFTLGRLHPAFNYHQKEFFSDMLDKLYRIRTDKSSVVKSAVGVPNYPPGFGYPNQIVPYDRYVILCDQSSTIHQQPPQLQQQPLDTVCIVKTSSTVPSSSSTQGVVGACAGGDMVVVAAPPPLGLQPAQPQHQYQHHPQQYEHVHTTYWRQQPMYTLSDAHMMAPPPQPVSPLVSQCASPPHSRPASPSLSNHSTQSTSSTSTQQQQQQQHMRSSSASLRGSKTSPLDSHNSHQPTPMQQVHQMALRMPSTTVFLAPGSIQQIHTQQNEVVKMVENESNHVLSDDVKSSNSLLHQDWTNPALTSHLHNLHTAQPAHFTFAPHHPQQLAPHNAQAPNGLRQCFATNFQQHHAVIAMDQQQAMFGYDLDYQQQQHLNDIQLDNTLHRSGSSSNNSSNASSLNQSPPDTPASTPTPAHHGPGRGSRDGIGGITEKLRVLNNVNNVSFMTPPPPPISDGNVPPQQQSFTANVPYTGFGAGRPIYGRIPSFGHSFSAPPPPLTPALHVHAAQAQVQPQATAYIMGTAYIVPTILSTNGNNSAVPPHTNSNTITASLRSHQHSHQQPISTNTNSACAGTNASTSLAGAMLTSPSSGICCTFCCNCGSADHRDEDCTVPHIDDIVTQAGYALDYDDSSGGGGGSVVGHGQGGAQGTGGPAIVAIDHVRPDI